MGWDCGERCPDAFGGALMADAFLMRHQIELLKPSLGLQPEQGPFLANARQLYADGVSARSVDTPVALRLLAMSGDQPMEQRI